MKKFIAGLLLVLTLLSIASCGGAATFKGTWKLVKAEMGGTTIDVEIMKGSIVLNEDGTGKYSFMGMDLDATWEEVDSTTAKFSYVSLGGTTNNYELKIDGKQLLLTEDITGIKYIYEK